MQSKNVDKICLTLRSKQQFPNFDNVVMLLPKCWPLLIS